MSPTTLSILPTDILIHILSFLSPPDILLTSHLSVFFRQLCQTQRIVWTNALLVCERKGWMVPIGRREDADAGRYADMSIEKIKASALKAWALAARWRVLSSGPDTDSGHDSHASASAFYSNSSRGIRSGMFTERQTLAYIHPPFPRKITKIEGTSGTSISDVRFLDFPRPCRYPSWLCDDSVSTLPGRGYVHTDHLLITISKSVWSALSVWRIDDTEHVCCVIGEMDEDKSKENKAKELPNASAKVAEWSPRGGIFTGFAVNRDPQSEVTLVVGLVIDETPCVKFLSLTYDSSTGKYDLVETHMHALSMTTKPVLLDGDILILADEYAKCVVLDWRRGVFGVLDADTGTAPEGNGAANRVPHQTNECLQALLAHESVLVVRARDIQLFRWPVLKGRMPRLFSGSGNRLSASSGSTMIWRVGNEMENARIGQHTSAVIGEDDHEPEPYGPLAMYSFGWVDGMCVSICPFLELEVHLESVSVLEPEGGKVRPYPEWNPLCILVRGESDDPWASDAHHLEMWVLDVNQGYRSPFRDSNKDKDLEGFVSEQTPSSQCKNLSPPINTDTLSSPYIFPPRLLYTVPSLRGSLRCKTVLLGRFGTAVWIQPRDRFVGGLLADTLGHMPGILQGDDNLSWTTQVVGAPPGIGHGPLHGFDNLDGTWGGNADTDANANMNLVEENRIHGFTSASAGSRFRGPVANVHESLVVCSFPGPLNPSFVHGSVTKPKELQRTKIFGNENTSTSWTSFDYDEVGGRIVVSSSFGSVLVLEL